MKLISALLIMIGLSTIGVAIAGVHRADDSMIRARTAMHTAKKVNSATTAGTEDQLAKTRQSTEFADEAEALMKLNRTVFMSGWSCLIVGVGLLAMQRAWSVLKSTGIIGKGERKKR